MAVTPATKKATKRAPAKAKKVEESTPSEAPEVEASEVEGAVPAEPEVWQRYGNSKRPAGTEPDQYGNIGVAPEFSIPRRKPVSSESSED